MESLRQSKKILWLKLNAVKIYQILIGLSLKKSLNFNWMYKIRNSHQIRRILTKKINLKYNYQMNKMPNWNS